MEEKKEELQESEIIKAVKDEYEKKIADMQAGFEVELEKIKQQHIEQIRALVSGRTPEVIPQQEPKEPSIEEEIYNGLKQKYRL